MTRRTRAAVFLCSILSLSLVLASASSVMPFSQLTEEALDSNPAVTLYYVEALDTAAYYPNLEEAELVAGGCAYFAPIITFGDEGPVLILNAIVALQKERFGLRAIEFTYADTEMVWDIETFDASDDGFYADEGFLTVDQALLEPLMFIAANVLDDIHMTFWGSGSEPLHFSLTKTQKETIRLFVDLYIGEPLKTT